MDDIEVATSIGQLARKWRERLQVIVDENVASERHEFDAALELALRELLTSRADMALALREAVFSQAPSTTGRETLWHAVCGPFLISVVGPPGGKLTETDYQLVTMALRGFVAEGRG